MRKGDDVVVAGLAGKRCRGVGRGRRGVDGYGISEVAGCEEGALERNVVRRACNLDATECQPRA